MHDFPLGVLVACCVCLIFRDDGQHSATILALYFTYQFYQVNLAVTLIVGLSLQINDSCTSILPTLPLNVCLELTQVCIAPITGDWLQSIGKEMHRCGTIREHVNWTEREARKAGYVAIF